MLICQIIFRMLIVVSHSLADNFLGLFKIIPKCLPRVTCFKYHSFMKRLSTEAVENGTTVSSKLLKINILGIHKSIINKCLRKIFKKKPRFPSWSN